MFQYHQYQYQSSLPYIADIEEFCERFYHKFRKHLPIIARVLLLSTFMEDGLRMTTSYESQERYFAVRFSAFGAFVIIIVNLLSQLIPSIMILLGIRLKESIITLAINIFFQNLVYDSYLHADTFFKSISLLGCLCLLLANSRTTTEDAFRQVLAFGNEDTIKSYLQLAGRILVVFMFGNLIGANHGFFGWMFALLCTILLFFVIIGFKAKTAGFLLTVLLLTLNFVRNSFWTFSKNSYDYGRYNFFHTLSVVGGLLMLVNMGAGELSIDGLKKEY